MSPTHPINMSSIGLKLMKIEQIKKSRFYFPVTVGDLYHTGIYLCDFKFDEFTTEDTDKRLTTNTFHPFQSSPNPY